MGIFGKIFEKKECAICGGEIGLLGNRKLDDGNLCKECARKLSPWFTERRRSTVEDIRKQLNYREQNKEQVRRFHISREFKGSSLRIFIDDSKGQFAVASAMNEEVNPDILLLTQITSCILDIDQDREEIYYKDSEGKEHSYNPPQYKYSYDYTINLTVNSPWFDDMKIKLNSFSIEERDRHRIVEMENLGNEIIMALTRKTGAVNSMQSGRYDQSGTHMQGNFYNQPGIQNNTQTGIYNQPNVNMQSNFGNQQSMGFYNQPPMIRCDKCGWIFEDQTILPKFCPNCGDPIDQNDLR